MAMGRSCQRAVYPNRYFGRQQTLKINKMKKIPIRSIRSIRSRQKLVDGRGGGISPLGRAFSPNITTVF